MKVIIEAGSTKTDIALIQSSNSNIHRLEHMGLNPMTDIDFSLNLHHLIDRLSGLSLTQLYYYGSGCIDAKINGAIADQFTQRLTTLDIVEIEDDMLAAARATMKKESGIACIIGTGSNAARYDGIGLTLRADSGGYLLGDEGSGFRIGQQLYLYYVRKWFSKEEVDYIYQETNLKSDEAVRTLYEHRNPRTFLASFAKLIDGLNPTNKAKILEEIFHQLVHKMIKPLWVGTNDNVHFVGSIAHHFQEIIREKLAEEGISSGLFIKSPIDELISYHL